MMDHLNSLLMVTPAELERYKQMEKAIKDIAPWLSASMSNGTYCCKEYILACEAIFELDKGE